MLLAAALLSLATAATAAAAEVLARVDGTEITRADLDERLRVLAAARRPAAPDRALSDLVDEALLAAEARRRGLQSDPALVEDLAREKRRLVVDAYLASAAESSRPTEAQLREMYHASGDQLRLTLVKVTTEAEAKELAAQVRRGGALVADPRSTPDAALAARGGDTGRVSRASLDPALADAAFRARVGDVVGPVQLKLGWAVARVVEREIADEAGFPDRRAALEEMARASAAAQVRAHLLEQLRRASGVQVDEAFLATLGDRTDVTREELDHVIATVHGEKLSYRAIHPDVAQLFGLVRGHGIGPRARIEIAWKEVDLRLLSHEALAKGFGAAAPVRAVLPGIERNLLAGALAARIGRSADLRDPAVKAQVDGLRKHARIEIDRAKVGAGGSR
jgi:peptidyl-prolyl cis-trans isomerase C